MAMSYGFIFALIVAGLLVLMLVVGFIGNKVVDKCSDAFHNKSVRRQNVEKPAEAENLADRYKH